MATPTVAAISRCGSRVAASDMTTKVTCPGSSRFMPCARGRMRHPGGKMLETRTRLQAAMPADRSASSKEVSFSRCLPTPLVKNISLGTNPTTSRSLSHGKVHGKQQVSRCQETDERRQDDLTRVEPHVRFALVTISEPNRTRAPNLPT